MLFCFTLFVFHQYTILCKERNQLKDHLNAKGVGSGIYYPTLLYDYDPMSEFVADCPNAKRLTDMALSLPVHPNLSNSDVSKVFQSVISFFE